MAKRRTLHKKISLSEQVANMTEFAQMLFTWMIPHTDDFGRLSGEPRVVKAMVVPLSERTVDDVAQALKEMVAQELIQHYSSNDGRVIQIIKFDEHQTGLQKRTKSKYPPPPGIEDVLDTSELDIEDLLCQQLETGQMQISDAKLVQIQRQYRIGNSYLDILCHDATGQLFVIEVKRQRLSVAALKQIVRYGRKLEESGDGKASLILAGHGLSHNFDVRVAQAQGVNVITFDDMLSWCQLTASDVKCQWVDVNERQVEEKGNEVEEEEKGKEPVRPKKRTPQKKRKQSDSEHHKTVAGYLERISKGYEKRHTGKFQGDLKAIKQMLRRGHTSGVILACYDAFKSEAFWASKHLSIRKINEDIDDWVKAGGKSGPRKGQAKGRGRQEAGELAPETREYFERLSNS